MDSTAAILLRKTKLTETSLIISWLTHEHGRIKTVAKGARQPKSKFAGLLDLGFECEIAFVRSRTSELHTLREVALLAPRAGLRTDYLRLTLAAHFTELLEIATEPDHPMPEIYDLLRRALNYLDEHSATKKALLHFESELVKLLGIANPALSPIVSIGRTYHHTPHGRAAMLDKLA